MFVLMTEEEICRDICVKETNIEMMNEDVEERTRERRRKRREKI